MQWEDISSLCAPLLARDAELAALVRHIQGMPEVMEMMRHLWDTYPMLRLSATLMLRALVAQRYTTSLVTPPIRNATTDASFDALLRRHEAWPADHAHVRAFRTLCNDSQVREGMRALYYGSQSAQAVAMMAAGLLDSAYRLW